MKIQGKREKKGRNNERGMKREKRGRKRVNGEKREEKLYLKKKNNITVLTLSLGKKIRKIFLSLFI